MISIDASELAQLGTRMTAAKTVSRAMVAASVKKGAQNVKTAIHDDVSSSGNSGFKKIRITYDLGSEGDAYYADIATQVGGSSNLANIAFFGTAKGGGTHQFYEHATEELPALAKYVGQAASSALDTVIWG